MMKSTTLLSCALALLPLIAHAQTRMECLGYHVVNVPGEVEEATEPPTENHYIQIGGGQFSDTLRVMEDGFDSGELTVEVSDPTTRAVFDKSIPRKYTPSIVDGRPLEPVEIQDLRSKIKRHREMIADREHNDCDGCKEAVEHYRKSVAKKEAEIKAWEAIPEIWADPNSYYYDGWLWLWREPRIFRIALKAKRANQTRQEATLAIIPRFRTRALGEIPAEPGFCVPYGFVAGVPPMPLPYYSQTTLRMKDEPGLLYTVRIQSFEHPARRSFYHETGPGWKPFTLVEDTVRPLGIKTPLKGWHSPTPYREVKLPDGHYNVVVTQQNGLAATVKRATSKGEVFALTAILDGAENDITKPVVYLLFGSYSFLKIDPKGLQAPAVKPLKTHLPGLKRFANSLRMRPENEKAFREMKK